MKPIGQKLTKKMKKYTSKISKQIVDLFRADTYTIYEICRIVRISKSTLYRWMGEYPDFAQEIEDAKEERSQILVVEAKKSLMRKIKGYDVTETKIVTVPGKKKDKKGNYLPIIKEQITTKKHIQADTAAIIFTLTNGDPDNWKNRHYNEITGKNGSNLFSEKSDEELNEIIDELKRKLT